MSKIMDFIRGLFATCTLTFIELQPAPPRPAHTQKALILAHLQAGRSITEQQARDLYHISKLQARISELRKAGYKIQTEWVGPRKCAGSYARYWLTEVDE